MASGENKRSVTVGIFVAVAVVIFVTGIFTLGGQQKKFGDSTTVKAIFDDVSGLKTGNNVWFSGVKVGIVKKITFSDQAKVEVTMSVDEKARQFIHKDASAKISSESLIGNKNVVIYGGSDKVATVEDNDVLKVTPLLSTEDMMATLQENNKNLLAITDNFKELSAKIVRGEGPMGMLLTDSTLADNFRSVAASLQKTSNNTVKASGALSQFTAKLNTPGGLANQVLTDTVVFSQLKSSVTQLQRTTSAAAQATSNLQESTNKLNSDNNALGLLLNDKQFAGQMKKTMNNLETSTEKLDENMEALQHNFLLRGFFKKKAKQKAQQKAQME